MSNKTRTPVISGGKQLPINHLLDNYVVGLVCNCECHLTEKACTLYRHPDNGCICHFLARSVISRCSLSLIEANPCRCRCHENHIPYKQDYEKRACNCGCCFECGEKG